MRELTEPLDPRAGTSGRYPWREIAASTNGYLLVRGEDYKISDAAFRAQACGWAARHGLHAITSRTDEGMAIRFVKREDHPNADLIATNGHG